MAIRKTFLGTGWGFPVTFSKEANGNCGVRIASELEDILESLNILFTTRPGERVMRPDYGASLEDLLFEPANISLITYVKEMIRQAILFYEPRIILNNSDISTERLLEGVISIELQFTVRATNNRFNYVFDYYKREATITQL